MEALLAMTITRKMEMDLAMNAIKSVLNLKVTVLCTTILAYLQKESYDAVTF